MATITSPGVALTGGAAVVRALSEQGVDVVFGIPGTHNLEIYRYLAESGIRHVTPRHEQGAGYAADGFARVTGRPGIVLTTSGPGLTNATTAAATSYADSIPVLLISPGVPVGAERADLGSLHEVKDQVAHLDALLERSIRVRHADEIGPIVAEIFAHWRRARPRPVHLEVPLDILEGPWIARDTPIAEIAITGPVRAAVIEAAAIALARARRPAILLGGGARAAGTHARQLAELIDAPVVTTVNGKGVLDESHPLSLGASVRLAPAQTLLSESDVLLVVGSEVGDSDLWGGAITPSGQTIRIDIDASQSNKNLTATLPIVGDAGTVLAAILVHVGNHRLQPRGNGAERAMLARAAIESAALITGSPWREVQDVLRAALPADVIVAGDSAQVSYYGTVHFWPMDTPRRFLYPTGYATLGYGLPAAIGAKIAFPERAVVVLVGDGGFQFTAMELVTAVAEGLQLIVVIMNNHGFREIKDGQLARGITPIAVDIIGPDFAALARACGCFGVTLEGLNGLEAAVSGAMGADLPTVIEIRLPRSDVTGQVPSAW